MVRRKRKSRPSLAALIYKTVKNDYNEDQRFMTISTIAERIFGRGYEYGNAIVRGELEGKIRRATQATILYAKRKGRTFFPDRIPTQNDDSVKDRIYGWKIASPGDEVLIADEARYKKKYRDARGESLESFLDTAARQGLISKDAKLALGEGDDENN